MKYILITILLVLISCSGQENEQKEYFLLPYQVGEKWGLADTLGNLRVDPSYDEILDFSIFSIYSKSLYFVRKESKIQLIDAFGNEYLQDYNITYDKIGKRPMFSKNGKMGKLSRSFDSKKNNFSWIESLPFEYDSIYSSGDSGWDIIVKDGKKGMSAAEAFNPFLIIPVKYDSISTIDEDDWEAYNLDRNGEIILTQTYNYGKDIDDSMLISSPHMDPTGPFISSLNSLSKQDKLKYDLIKYDDAYYYNRFYQWLIVRKNDKYALMLSYNIPEEPFEFVYDTIYLGEDRRKQTNVQSSNDLVFILKKENQYGIIPVFSKLTQPKIQYDYIFQEIHITKSIFGDGIVEMPYLIFKKGKVFGADQFDHKANLINRVPFEFDSIIDRNIVIKNKKYGVYDLINHIKIDTKYIKKPKEFKLFDGKGGRYKSLYECVNEEGKKILVYRNGVEMYKKEE